MQPSPLWQLLRPATSVNEALRAVTLPVSTAKLNNKFDVIKICAYMIPSPSFSFVMDLMDSP